MTEYNPHIIDWDVFDCPCWREGDRRGWGLCYFGDRMCPVGETKESLAIPSDCPAREGIIIKVKE